MKKLPKIYRSELLNPKDNNQKYYYFDNKSRTNNVEEVLNSIFSSYSSLFHKKVEIMTNKKTYHTFLVSRTNHYVMTMEKEIIPIKDIIEIKD